MSHVKSFITLAVTNSHHFLFALIWNMALMCIPFYNLKSYKYFRRVFVEVSCDIFMRFVKVMFFFMKFYNKIYLHEKFITEFIYFFTLTHVPVPWMNKFLITENIFLPC